MEKYVIIDAVLQASHMKRFHNEIRTLKKYDLNQPRSLISNLKCKPKIQCHTLTLQDPLKSEKQHKKQQNKIKPKNNRSINNFLIQSKQNTSSQCRGKQNLYYQAKQVHSARSSRNKQILHDHEKAKFKVLLHKDDKKGPLNMEEFFIQKKIDSNSKNIKQKKENTRALSSRRYNKKIEATFFYDYNIDTIKNRQKACIILPQHPDSELRPIDNNSKKEKKLTIKEIINQEVQEQKRKRIAACKTAGNFPRHKAVIAKQSKKIEEEIRAHQYSQKPYKQTVISQNLNHSSGLQLHKSIMALSRQQIKTQSLCIMDKYKVDIDKYFFKIHGQ